MRERREEEEERGGESRGKRTKRVGADINDESTKRHRDEGCGRENEFCREGAVT